MPQNPNLFEITQSIKLKMRHANRHFNFRLEKRCRGLIISTFGTVPSKYRSKFYRTRKCSDRRYDFTHDGGGTSRDSGNGNHQNHNDLSLINQLDNTCIYSKPIQEAKRMYYTYK